MKLLLKIDDFQFKIVKRNERDIYIALKFYCRISNSLISYYTMNVYIICKKIFY